jgi:large subunit ribosomal protein L15
MNLSNLKPAIGSTKDNKRLGRGQGSGGGGTATRGHKGAQSRSGYSSKKGFEGGQMPLYRRVPKGGFKNINRIEYTAINISTLQLLHDNFNITVFNHDVLQKHGLISKSEIFKVLGKGNLTTKIDVVANAFSETAVTAIESLGGTATKI